MEPIGAMQTAAALLGIGALGGLVMAVIRLRGAPRPPSSFAMGHGLIAAAALTLLIYAWATAGIPPLAKAATAVLVLAGLGGGWLNLRYHSRMLPLPIGVMIAHALLAATGFGLLLLCLFQNHAL